MRDDASVHEPPTAQPAPESSPERAEEPFQHLEWSEPYPYALRDYVRRTLWLLVQRTLVRYSLPRAYRWRRFWLRRFGATMADTACTRPRTWIIHPWLLTMEPRTMLADGVRIYNLGPIRLGEQTLISDDAFLCAGTHDYTHPSLPLQRPPIHVGRGVWICAQAFIGPGVRIGDNSVVGARAVVSRDVPAGVVVAGNPAQVIKPRDRRTASEPKASVQ